MALNEADAAGIEAALSAAQQRTSGPIVCVLARASSSYEMIPLIWSILIALAAPWPLLLFTQLSAERIFLMQLGLFLVVLAILSLTALGVALTPRSVQRANAHRAALGQFMIRGIPRNPERNGVLIYVSLTEHYGRIVADEAAAAAIGQGEWQGVVNKMLAGIKRGAVADSLIAAGQSCGDLLAPRFPPKAADPGRPTHGHFHLI
jgi:putative membrane protein